MTDKEFTALIAAKDTEINNLRRQVAELQNNLSVTKNIGSIAEAALEVNGVFTAAQKAADEYLTAAMNINSGAQERCREMINETKDYCDKLIRDTKYKCTSMETQAKNRSAEILFQAQENARTSLSDVTNALRDYYLRHEDKLRELPSDLQRLIRSPR